MAMFVKLQLSMLGTIALIIGISTLFFTIILSLMGVMNIMALGFMVVVFNLLQWLFAPHMINAIYKTKEVTPGEIPNYMGWWRGFPARLV